MLQTILSRISKISSTAFSSTSTIKVIDYEICFSKDPIKIYYSGTFTATRSRTHNTVATIHCRRTWFIRRSPELFTNIRVIVLSTIYYHRQDEPRALPCSRVVKFLYVASVSYSLCIVTVTRPLNSLRKHNRPTRRRARTSWYLENKKQGCCLKSYRVTWATRDVRR